MENENGVLIGVKWCRHGVIVKLEIPADARRMSNGKRCRCEFAKVLQVFGGEVGVSTVDPTFVYRVGEMVKAHAWTDEWDDESGIFFYKPTLDTTLSKNVLITHRYPSGDEYVVGGK